MRLIPVQPIAGIILPARKVALGLLCLCAASWASPQGIVQDQTSTLNLRERLHETQQWREVQPYLPDPVTATPQALEQEADILRARRFPDDALDYYKYALARGGNQASILNKMGLTELEMRNVELARACFQRSVKIGKKDPDAWNNLGAVEYLDRLTSTAISDYKHAIKLDQKKPVFHANLATAYFETRNFGGARREMAAALRLDPDIFDKEASSGGVEAHVLTSEDRARFSFEMAKLYARNDQQEQMLHSLAMAAEAGMDVQRAMERDPVLATFEMDPRVVTLVHNARMLRAARGATAASPAALPADATPQPKLGPSGG
jgi:tetratricopeptide (TPR) repeat protein